MWTEPVVTVAAAQEPVSLEEAKAHVRVLSSNYDADLAIYIAAARDFAEKYTGLRIAPQTVQFSASRFSNEAALPVAPVQSLVINYLDTEKVSQTLDPTSYVVGGISTLRPIVRRSDGRAWPSLGNHPEAVTVTAEVGYGDTPDAVRAAILLMVGHWFDNRETVSTQSLTEAPLTSMALLENYRTFT